MEEKESNNFLDNIPYTILGNFSDDKDLMLHLVDVNQHRPSVPYSGGSHAWDGWMLVSLANMKFFHVPPLVMPWTVF